MPATFPELGIIGDCWQALRFWQAGMLMHFTLHPSSPENLQTDGARLAYAREIVRAEGDALHLVSDRLGESFLRAIDLVYRCPGRVGITGTGKSADVGQKIAGTLNSTGTRS